MNIQIFGHKEEFLQAALDVIAQSLSFVDDTFFLALSGGSTPVQVYRALAQHKTIPFEKIELFQVDERYVPPDHPESNYRLIRENLLEPLHNRFPKRQVKDFVFFDTTLSPEQSLQKYALKLKKKEKIFDLTILGIGIDGHFASLFPFCEALVKSIEPVAHTVTQQFSIPDRLTLTLEPILKSRNILVLLQGQQKKFLLQKLGDRTLQIQEFPAAALQSHPALHVFFLNQE